MVKKRVQEQTYMVLVKGRMSMHHVVKIIESTNGTDESFSPFV